MLFALSGAGIVSPPILIYISPSLDSCDLVANVKHSVFLSLSLKLFLHIQSLISSMHASSLAMALSGISGSQVTELGIICIHMNADAMFPGMTDRGLV